MLKFKVGDYVLSKKQQVFRIVDLYEDQKDGKTYYDIKGMNKTKFPLEINYIETYEYASASYGYSQIKCINSEMLEDFGTVIPEEKATDFLEILYGKQKSEGWGFRNS